MYKDLNMLLDMEIRIRLLDVEGIVIFNEFFFIFLELENYDFVFFEF